MSGDRLRNRLSKTRGGAGPAVTDRSRVNADGGSGLGYDFVSEPRPASAASMSGVQPPYTP